MSTPALRKLCELPLGSWFRYQGHSGVRSDIMTFILIDRGDCGLVAHAPPPRLQGHAWTGQGIYSAADTQQAFRELIVEFVPVSEVA